MSHRTGRDAFTLIELLVVIGIIAILAAMMMPALRSAREWARRTTCTNNLHQTSLAIEFHRGDAGALPPFLSALYPECLDTADLLVCPSDDWAGAEGSKPRWDKGQHSETDDLPSNLTGEAWTYTPGYDPPPPQISRAAYTINYDNRTDVRPHDLRNTAITACSYIYEFSVARVYFPTTTWEVTLPDLRKHGGNGDTITTWREYKTAVDMNGLQDDGTKDTLQAYFQGVPLARCFYHTTRANFYNDTVLNLAVNHSVYRSDPTTDGWKEACKPTN